MHSQNKAVLHYQTCEGEKKRWSLMLYLNASWKVHHVYPQNEQTYDMRTSKGCYCSFGDKGYKHTIDAMVQD